MRRLLIVALIGSGSSLVATQAMTDAGFLRTAQSDEASPSTSASQANPSRAEPMMLGPTQDEDAANYRSDFVACDSQVGAQREACQRTVDRQYRPEVTNLSGDCQALDGSAKADCLKRNGPEK